MRRALLQLFSCTCRNPHAQPHLHLLFTAHGMELQNTLPGVFRGQTQKWEADSAKMKTENSANPGSVLRQAMRWPITSLCLRIPKQEPFPQALMGTQQAYSAVVLTFLHDPNPWKQDWDHTCCHRPFAIKTRAERTGRTGCTSLALSFIVYCWNLETQYRQVSV